MGRSRDLGKGGVKVFGIFLLLNFLFKKSFYL